MGFELGGASLGTKIYEKLTGKGNCLVMMVSYRYIPNPERKNFAMFVATTYTDMDKMKIKFARKFLVCMCSAVLVLSSSSITLQAQCL